MQTPQSAGPPARRRSRKDATPPGGTGKPVVVFLSPAQHEALAMCAEDQGDDLASVLRRALRFYLHQLAVNEASAEATNEASR